MQKIPEAWDMIIPIVEEKSYMEGFEEGRMQGLEEARIEGFSAVAEKLIARGVHASEVCEITGLPIKIINKISSKSKHL